MLKWNPHEYLKFAGERTRPSVDLAARIEIENPRSIIDIGCGPGNSTQVLRSRWPAAKIIGLDSSAEMIARASKDFPESEWITADVSSYSFPTKHDIVFSNAAIQWIPDHDELLPRLMDAVSSGGVFAVQVPSDAGSPLRLALLEVSARPEWNRFVAGAEKLAAYHDADYYYNILAPISSKFDLWETTYYHLLDFHKGLVEWYKGTGMRPFLERIPDEKMKIEFQNQILNECVKAYRIQDNGKLLYPFKRTFFIATK
ncbi:MAG TPA: methyltransferase domain-containing protein [Candidatus Kryptonia bacterium]